ncbi:MAG TPA: hypothetical protein VMH83_04300, partial [Candidatus Acidoferrum sp.]|nr:hypothetical protein [Candidatus Acidoferrum sp.]
MNHPLLAQMQQLEAALLHTDFRDDPAALEAMLAADFQEVSPLGSKTDRADVMQWLLQKDPAQRWQFSDWQVDEPAIGLRIVRYHAVRTLPASASKGAR